MCEQGVFRNLGRRTLVPLIVATVASQVCGTLLAEDRFRIAIDDNRSDLLDDRSNPGRAPVTHTNPNQGTTTSISRSSVVSVAETLGELEVAVSSGGNKAVVAVNNLVGHAPFSQDTIFYLTASGTFSPSSLDPPLKNNRDPTIARGGNSRFYYAALVGSNVNVGVSADGGATFTLVGPDAGSCVTKGVVSTTPPCPAVAQCFPARGARKCKSDQPHLAADPGNSGPPDHDQLYIVWRETDTFRDLRGDVETQMIQCSADGGQTWKKPVAVGRGMFARVHVDGNNGSVYVVFVDQRTGIGKIFIQKFSACKEGLTPSFSDSPGRLVTQFSNLPCPIPGLDRCNDGNILASPTVTADGPNVFVTYADNTAPDNDSIVIAVSEDGGATFPLSKRQTMSAHGGGRRFMPWSCASGGQVFVGWFDRGTASSSAPDLTTYHLRSMYMPHFVNGSPPPQLSNDLDLSGGVEDRQCSVWPRSPRSSADSTSCDSSSPPRAGVCAPASPTRCGRQKDCSGTAICANGFCIAPGRLDSAGNAPRCNFASNNCRAGERCATGRGGPKYGDYNGFACSGNQAFVAWPSTIPPAGAQHPIGSATSPRLTVYFATVDATPPTPGPVPNNPPPPPPPGAGTGGICNVDSDCHGANEHCLNGICKPRGPQCTTSAQCPSGTACVNRSCLPI